MLQYSLTYKQAPLPADGGASVKVSERFTSRLTGLCVRVSRPICYVRPLLCKLSVRYKFYNVMFDICFMTSQTICIYLFFYPRAYVWIVKVLIRQQICVTGNH